MRMANAPALALLVVTASVLAGSAAARVTTRCSSDAHCGVDQYCGWERDCVSCEWYGNVAPLVNSTKPNCNCANATQCQGVRTNNAFTFCSRRRTGHSPTSVTGGICRLCPECNANTIFGTASSCPAYCACASGTLQCSISSSPSAQGFCSNYSANGPTCSSCVDGSDNQCTLDRKASGAPTCATACNGTFDCDRNHTHCGTSLRGPVCTVARKCQTCERCARFAALAANGSAVPTPSFAESFNAACPAGGACCAWTVGLRGRDDPRGGADAYTFASTCDANGTVTVQGLYLVHPKTDAVPPVLSVMERRMLPCETVPLYNSSVSPYPIWRIHCPRIDRECLDTDYSFAVIRTDVASGNKTVLVWPQKGYNYREESDGDKCFDRKWLLTILVCIIVISAACVFVGVAIIYEKCHYRLEALDAKNQRKAKEEEMRKREDGSANEPTR